MILDCRRCHKPTIVNLKWREMVAGGWHLGAWCALCGGWVKWMPQTSENVHEAPPQVANESEYSPMTMQVRSVQDSSIVVAQQDGVVMHDHDILPPILVLVQSQSAEGTPGKFRRTDTGEEYDSLAIVPVRVQATRTRMPGEFNRESKPLCWSADGMHPAPGGDQHGVVEKCTDCGYYTATPWTAGPEDCKGDYAVMFLSGAWDPFLMRLRGTASRLARVLGAKGIFRAAWLSLGVEAVTNDKGKWYAPVVKTQAKLGPEELDLLREVIASGLQSASIEVRQDEPAGGTLPAKTAAAPEETSSSPKEMTRKALDKAIDDAGPHLAEPAAWPAAAAPAPAPAPAQGPGQAPARRRAAV